MWFSLFSLVLCFHLVATTDSAAKSEKLSFKFMSGYFYRGFSLNVKVTSWNIPNEGKQHIIRCTLWNENDQELANDIQKHVLKEDELVDIKFDFNVGTFSMARVSFVDSRGEEQALLYLKMTEAGNSTQIINVKEEDYKKWKNEAATKPKDNKAKWFLVPGIGAGLMVIFGIAVVFVLTRGKSPIESGDKEAPIESGDKEAPTDFSQTHPYVADLSAYQGPGSEKSA
jgi:hypothetical protein